MKKTQNYNLNQWEATDKLCRADFNADNAAIDAALAAKAEQSAVTALSTALGSGGKTCRIAWGSYTGTGTYGSDNPNSLTFDFCPILILIGGTTNSNSTYWPSILIRGATRAKGDTTSTLMALTWTDNGVSWYSGSSATNQNNGPYTYHYVAVGYTQ